MSITVTSRRYDMRFQGRREFLETVRRDGAEISKKFGRDMVPEFHSEGPDIIVTWTDRPGPDLGQFELALDRHVQAINGGSKMPNVTGASLLGDSFRSQLAAVKKKIGDAKQRMDRALSDLDDTAGQAVDMAKAVEVETADLKASMGLHTNNPPVDAQ